MKMINRNGYTIEKESNSIESLKRYARALSMKSFFIWIYDKINCEMICQNIYTNRFKRCNNETFVPYF